MARISFFVDGFNVYHALIDLGYNRYKWLDYRKLAGLFIRPTDSISEIRATVTSFPPLRPSN